MKSLLLALAFVSASFTVANTAMATSPIPLRTVAQLEGNLEGITKVALMEDGSLSLVDESGHVLRTSISSSSSQLLLESAKMLSTVKVTIETPAAICYVMPPHELADLYVAPYDESTSSYAPAPRFILSADGCYVVKRASPTDREALMVATELRAQLLILALEANAKK